VHLKTHPEDVNFVTHNYYCAIIFIFHTLAFSFDERTQVSVSFFGKKRQQAHLVHLGVVKRDPVIDRTEWLMLVF
jgi:hypothetical protein